MLWGMVNTGSYPIDPTTEVGLFRQELGDVNGVPADPATDPQTAEYEYISDAAIAALILASPTSRDTAMANAMRSFANQLILAAQDIQVDEIRIKTIERARLMMEFASGLLAGASATDASTAFTVVGLSSHPSYGRPQGTPWPYPGSL